MSWKLQALISERLCGSMARKMILINMAARANDDGTGIYAALPTLATWCEVNVSTVRRTIRELEADGLIFVAGKREVRTGWVYDWSINIEAVEALTLAKDEVQKVREIKNKAKTTPGVTPPLAGRHPLPGATPCMVEPVANCAATPGMAPPKPILEPSSFSSKTTSSQKKVVPSDSDFDQVWRSWPQRGRSSKAESRKLWMALAKAHGAERLRSAVQAYLASPDATKDAGGFVPAFERWLKKRTESWLEKSADAASQDAAVSDHVDDFLARAEALDREYRNGR